MPKPSKKWPRMQSNSLFMVSDWLMKTWDRPPSTTEACPRKRPYLNSDRICWVFWLAILSA